MTLKKMLLGAGIATMAVAVAPAANAAIFPIGSPNFFITSGTPFTPSISAVFFNGFDTATSFDDSFTFTIPQNGTGSGSLSTSFSSALNQLTVTDLIINGTSYAVPFTGNGQSVTLGGIPIVSGVLNTIRVIGFTTGDGGSYSGTATFTAAPIPEPATWGMMIAGFGALGFAMRRQRKPRVKVAFG